MRPSAAHMRLWARGSLSASATSGAGRRWAADCRCSSSRAAAAGLTAPPSGRPPSIHSGSLVHLDLLRPYIRKGISSTPWKPGSSRTGSVLKRRRLGSLMLSVDGAAAAAVAARTTGTQHRACSFQRLR